VDQVPLGFKGPAIVIFDLVLIAVAPKMGPLESILHIIAFIICLTIAFTIISFMIKILSGILLLRIIRRSRRHCENVLTYTEMNRATRRSGDLQAEAAELRRTLCPRVSTLRGIWQLLTDTFDESRDQASGAQMHAVASALFHSVSIRIKRSIIRRAFVAILVSAIHRGSVGLGKDWDLEKPSGNRAPPPGHQVVTQPVCPHGPPRQPAAPPEWATAGWLAA